MNFLNENHSFGNVIIAKTTYPFMKKVKKTKCVNFPVLGLKACLDGTE